VIVGALPITETIIRSPRGLLGYDAPRPGVILQAFDRGDQPLHDEVGIVS